VQLEDPVEALYQPAEQLVHTLATAAEYFPAAQLVQPLVEPVDAWYFPAGQFVQTVWPVLVTNVPVGQFKQLELAADAWYVPVGQLMQEYVAEAEKEPAGHDEQLEDPVVAW